MLEIFTEPGAWTYVVLKLHTVRVGFYLGTMRASIWRVNQ